MNYWMGVATLTGIYMIAILGVSILTGFTGLFSMGHAGFMAIGAYTSALITKTFHVPILVGVFCGMLTALVIGLIIGYPTLKLKGDYFVIATLGIGEVTKLIIENMPNLTGGARGLTDVPKGATFPVVLCFLVVIVWGLRNFLRSKHGRNCIAVRGQRGQLQDAGNGDQLRALRHFRRAFSPLYALSEPHHVQHGEVGRAGDDGDFGRLRQPDRHHRGLHDPGALARDSALRLRPGVAYGILRPAGGVGDHL